MSDNKKRSRFFYGLLRFLSSALAKIKFRRRFLRNEIKGKKGPFVIIANHAAALDFVNLIGASKEPMNFVISNSFYKTIPLRGIMPRLGLIPKQQFQTSLSDVRKMKQIIDGGGILVIYPSGLMSDDGTPTPMPVATYSFLKWMKADVYMAKNIGTYFSMPKWRKGGIRGGRTYTDIYKLFGKEELRELDIDEVRRRTNEALYFDAYEEQEELLIKYKNGHNIEGLENVLYICPHCKREFTVKTRDESVIYCDACGFEEKADEFQLLHKTGTVGEEIRHPSKWNALIHSVVKEQIESGELSTLSAKVEIQMIPKGKMHFEKLGEGEMTLTDGAFTINGNIGGEAFDLSAPTASFAALPYKPGKHLEIQHGDNIYRCLPEDGRIVIKFINMIKIFYEINTAESEKNKFSEEASLSARA